MVDALSSAWGHHPLALAPGCTGKVVWARINGAEAP